MTKQNKKNNNRRGNGLGPSTMKFTPVNPQSNIALRNVATKSGVPRIRSTTDGCVVRNEEMFGIIAGSASAITTTIASLSLNICDPTVFPWLSYLAVRYSLYRVKKMRVHLNSIVPTTVSGSATIGGFYDREDLLHWNSLGTTTTLSQTPKSSSGPTWSSTLHRTTNGITSDIMYEFDPNRLHARVPWYKCDAAPAGDTEFNQSVGCHLGVAIGYTGTASQQAVQVWFEYEIEFLHPATSLNNITLLSESGISNGVSVVDRPSGDRIFPIPRGPTPTPTLK